MRIFSFVLAFVVGILCWALVLALSGGVAPLGKVGQAEGLVFFTPIAVFAIPLAALALFRGHALASSWLLALAPLLGFANFALSASDLVRAAQTGVAAAPVPKTFALLWGALLAVVVLLLALGRKLAP